MLWKRRVYFFKLFYLAQSLTQSRYLIRIWRRREGRGRKKTQDRLHSMRKILSAFIQTTVSLQWSQSLWQIINVNQTKWLGWNFSHSSTQLCTLKPAKAQWLSCSSNSVIYLDDLQTPLQILWLRINEHSIESWPKNYSALTIERPHIILLVGILSLHLKTQHKYNVKTQRV